MTAAYPEIDFPRLTIQLRMFHSSYAYGTLTEAVDATKTAQPEIRELFSEVRTIIIRLLFIDYAEAAEQSKKCVCCCCCCWCCHHRAVKLNGVSSPPDD